MKEDIKLIVSGILKRITLAAVINLLLIILTAGMGLAGSPVPQMAPMNPAFIKYIHNKMAGDRPAPLEGTEAIGMSSGIVPSPLNLSHLTGRKVTPPVEDLVKAGLASRQTLPSSYDLRALGKVSAVKNQFSCGACWAFAAMSSLESYLLPGEMLDLSENNMKDLSGFDLGACQGGSAEMAIAYLVRWGGALNESDDPYMSWPSPVDLPAVRHTQEVLQIPNRANSLDNDNIKWAVMTYGAVFTEMYFGGPGYYNPSAAAYYFSGLDINHAAAIVGWNDTYPVSNFTSPPPGPGAFIVKSSWGTYFGDGGYFYVSYYDTMIGEENYVFTAEPATNYDSIYQYDPLGWDTAMGFGSETASLANIYTANGNEYLKAVSFYTPSINSTYSISVYTNVDKGPIDGLAVGTPQSGTIMYPGYHTVVLKASVPLTIGERFAVVVRLTTPGFNYPVFIEVPYSTFTGKATANPGEGFASSDGNTWTDMVAIRENTSVCLKAFTTKTPTCTYSISHSSGGAGSSGGTGSIDIDTQDGCLWTVANSLNWVALTTPRSGGVTSDGISVKYGRGRGSVSYTVAPNPGHSSRIGNIFVAGHTFVITQAATPMPCTYNLSQTGSSEPSGNGGTGTVTVTTQYGCPWTVSNNLGWVTITSPISAMSSGIVTFSVAPNTSAVRRTGRVTIAGKNYTINQDGNPALCTYSLAPLTSSTFGWHYGVGAFKVATQSGCPWAVSNPYNWIDILHGLSGTGEGYVVFRVSPDMGISRSGSLSVGGQTFTVRQRGRISSVEPVE